MEQNTIYFIPITSPTALIVLKVSYLSQNRHQWGRPHTLSILRDTCAVYSCRSRFNFKDSCRCTQSDWSPCFDLWLFALHQSICGTSERCNLIKNVQKLYLKLNVWWRKLRAIHKELFTRSLLCICVCMYTVVAQNAYWLVFCVL